MVDPTKGAPTHSGLDERLYSGLNLFSDFRCNLQIQPINERDIADEHAYLEGNTFSRIFVFSF